MIKREISENGSKLTERKIPRESVPEPLRPIRCARSAIVRVRRQAALIVQHYSFQNDLNLKMRFHLAEKLVSVFSNSEISNDV